MEPYRAHRGSFAAYLLDFVYFPRLVQGAANVATLTSFSKAFVDLFDEAVDIDLGAHTSMVLCQALDAARGYIGLVSKQFKVRLDFRTYVQKMTQSRRNTKRTIVNVMAASMGQTSYYGELMDAAEAGFQSMEEFGDRVESAEAFLEGPPESSGEYQKELNSLAKHIQSYKDVVGAEMYEDLIENPAKMREQVARHCGLDTIEIPLPAIEDDRGCATSYLSWMNQPEL